MRVYVTIKVKHPYDETDIFKHTLNTKWLENTCLSGCFKDDFDWLQCANKKCFFGRHINDNNITAFVVVNK